MLAGDYFFSLAAIKSNDIQCFDVINDFSKMNETIAQSLLLRKELNVFNQEIDNKDLKKAVKDSQAIIDKKANLLCKLMIYEGSFPIYLILKS